MSAVKSSLAILLAIVASAALAGAAFAVNSTLTISKAGSGSGTVTSDVGAINCDPTCSHTYADGTLITLTATPAGGSQFTGWLGPCTGAGTCQFTLDGATTATATFAAPVITTAMLDIDGTISCDALTDGLLALRYLFGLSGASLINDAVWPAAMRTTATQIGDYLLDVRPALDIDGNGQADALTDGLLIIRYQFGLRDAGLVAGAVGPGAMRITAPEIETHIQSLCLAPPPPLTLSVSLAGAGAGTVTSVPAGINCGAICSASYNNNTMVTLTAAPDALSFLSSWSVGGCPATSLTCTVTVTASSTATVTFGRRPVTTITRGPPPATNNSGSVTVEFTSDVAGSTFECVFNGGMATVCTSPRVYTGVASGINITIQVTAIDPAGNRDLSPAVATTVTTVASNPPPILRYTFDGNGSNTGAAAGFPATFNNVSFPAGKFGSAVKFNGTNATTAIIAGTNASFWRSTSSKWTIGFWFREDTQVDNAALLDLRDTQGWETFDSASAGGSLYTCASPNGCNNFTGPSLGAWHHILYRYDAASYTSGAALDVYLDGTLVASSAAGATPLVGPGVPDLLLGSGFGTSHFYVDDLKIYDNVYTPATQCTMIIGGTWNSVSAACVLPP